MKIGDGVHYLQHPLGAIWTGISLVEDEALLIVDTGTQAAAYETVLPSLRANNIWSGQPFLIVNTHCHCDHIGGNAGLQFALGAEIVAHQADASWIEDWALQYQSLYVTFSNNPELAFFPADYYLMAGEDTRLSRSLQEGDILCSGLREFEVLHLPGHTPGSLGLYEPSTGLLLTGDSIQGYGMSETLVPLIANLAAYRHSLEHLADLDIPRMIAAHPFQPFSTAIFDAHSAQSLIRQSLAAVEDTIGVTTVLLKAAEKPASLLEISQGLAFSLNLLENNLYNVILTAACLEELIGIGLALRISGEGWQLEGEFTTK